MTGYTGAKSNFASDLVLYPRCRDERATEHAQSPN
jgi:hypothetical protein